METYTMKLKDLISKVNLVPLYIPSLEETGGKELEISSAEVNRPGLFFAGFFDYFADNRIQLFGKMEYKYLEGFSEKERLEKFGLLFSRHIPALIITHGMEPYPGLLDVAKEFKVPVFSSSEKTCSVMASLISVLSVELAPRITRHGVLVEVYGEGILMVGDSGIGKSETAVELLKRGHRLIADDAVILKRVSGRTVVGTSPDIIRHLIELRGIGIVDVRRIFGMGAVKESEKVDLVVQLELWDESKQYDRMGLEYENYEILGLNIPAVTIPIRPGRNLALIIEIAAMNSRLRRMGYNSAKELNRRIMESMEEKAK